MSDTLSNLVWILPMPTNSIWALEQQIRNYNIFSISYRQNVQDYIQCLHVKGSCRTEESNPLQFPPRKLYHESLQLVSSLLGLIRLSRVRRAGNSLRFFSYINIHIQVRRLSNLFTYVQQFGIHNN